VTHGVMYQNGRERKVTRTSAEVPAPRKEIAVPADTLGRYAGTYQMSPALELTVTLEGAQLKAQLTGQPAFPIFAESETLFFYKVVDATLEFQKDASGAVNAVRLRQGPVDSVMPKK
jgi:serine-type D-Ala-D-Ala carboxypeptidase/endopeptidase